MQINTSKTKEMFLGRLIAANFPHLSTSAGLIERVTTFKLLGINFEANLSWSLHINTIAAKASKRLYFLKQLKRAGLPTDQLLHFYVAVIRPVVEYCAPVWHYAINRAQAEQLESTKARYTYNFSFYPWTFLFIFEPLLQQCYAQSRTTVLHCDVANLIQPSLSHGF